MRFDPTDPTSPLWAAIRSFESGTAEGDYHADNHGALGAYQMRAPALIEIGALERGGKVDVPDDWTGLYGARKEDFLADEVAQDDAALDYMKAIIARRDVREAFEQILSSDDIEIDGIPVSPTGLLLMAWESPADAATLVLDAEASTLADRKPRLYEDLLARLEVGAVLDEILELDPGETGEKVSRIVGEVEFFEAAVEEDAAAEQDQVESDVEDDFDHDDTPEEDDRRRAEWRDDEGDR